MATQYIRYPNPTANITPGSIPLTSAQILVGNGSNVAAAVAMTGDIGITNAGVTAIQGGVIVNADVNGSAAIAGSKIAPDFGAQNIVSTGTLSVNGRIAGSFASAGQIGEVIQSQVLVGSAISLTTATSANITSIILTAGNWLVSSQVSFNPGATTSIADLNWSHSNTTATLPAISRAVPSPTTGQILMTKASTAGVVPGGAVCEQVGLYPVGVSGNTTLFLVVNSTFSLSTLSAHGSIQAIRMA